MNHIKAPQVSAVRCLKQGSVYFHKLTNGDFEFRMALADPDGNKEASERETLSWIWLDSIVTAVNAHDRLVADNKRLSSLESYFLEAQRDYDRVKAENERLREALEYIITECGFINAGISNTTNILIKARAALEEK